MIDARDDGVRMVEEQVATSRAVAVRRVVFNRAVVELGAMAILAVIYNTIRAGGGGDQALAMAHARDIARIEGWIFHNVDLQLDHWIVGVPWLAVAACYFYALMHYVMTPTILVVSRRRGGWQYWRGYWALVAGSAIALVIYANWPLAPPRLMPELGTIDVMQHFANAGWWGDAASAPRGLGDATNQFAAMPSLHCGWALWCGIQMWGFGKRWWRVGAVAYPVLQAFVVLSTANHFFLDIVGGVTCILLGYAIVTVIGRLLGKTGTSTEATDGAADEVAVHDATRVSSARIPAQSQRQLADDDPGPVLVE